MPPQLPGLYWPLSDLSQPHPLKVSLQHASCFALLSLSHRIDSVSCVAQNSHLHCPAVKCAVWSKNSANPLPPSVLLHCRPMSHCWVKPHASLLQPVQCHYCTACCTPVQCWRICQMSGAGLNQQLSMCLSRLTLPGRHQLCVVLPQQAGKLLQSPLSTGQLLLDWSSWACK